MKKDRLIEILVEEYAKHYSIMVEQALLKLNKLQNPNHSFLIDGKHFITAMTRAVEEETARLRECEAIVRELAEYTWGDVDIIKDKAYQWVRENPESGTTKI